MIGENDILIVTGFSGAGKSSALNCLEDMGYEVFDNLPVTQILETITSSNDKNAKLAFGLDARTRGFSSEALSNLKTQIEKTQVIYIFCDEDILIRRYSETRRRHPMAEDETYGAGIQKERNILADIPHFADISIDTSKTSVAELKDLLKAEIHVESQKEMTVQFLSFGFKNGVPLNADMVIDARFLKNPHYDAKLKPKNGKDKDVGSFIRQDKRYSVFSEKLRDMIEFLIPSYKQEGKAHFTCAIGCTGGKHRSVFVAEELTNLFHGSVASHRDLGLE